MTGGEPTPPGEDTPAQPGEGRSVDVAQVLARTLGAAVAALGDALGGQWADAVGPAVLIVESTGADGARSPAYVAIDLATGGGLTGYSLAALLDGAVSSLEEQRYAEVVRQQVRALLEPQQTV